MTSSPPPNLQAELAKERNHISAERTLLAWIGTSITFIGIGFGVEQVTIQLYQGMERELPMLSLIKLFTLLLIGLGILTVILAAIDYRGEQWRLCQTDYAYTPRFSLGLMVAGALVVIAIGALMITLDLL
jgi:putative membrane protein